MDVKRIQVNVQCLLSASARINNYKRAVEELVYNSLDAESTCIAIRIHIQNNWLQVVDNGIGIKSADFKLLGERYATSKLVDLNTLKAVPSKYGYQGQALANIIGVSKNVKITSRYANSTDTWIKSFVRGKIEHECFKALVRPSKGTTVEISGFLYNLKIQKKNINAFNELQEIKTFLEQLMLVFNHVSISLRNDAENEIIFKMYKNRDIYQTLNSLFEIEMNDFQELHVEKNEYKVKAFIGVRKKGIENCHWIYLNKKFVNISNLHGIIANTFAKPNHMNDKKIKTMEAYYKQESLNICQSVPFYFLFITCPYYEYDIIDSGTQTTIEFKDWKQIITLFEKLIKFYHGDLNLIKVKKNNEEKQISENAKDTRKEVKNIIEKILGKSNKISRVSQMKHGIKGKRVKRMRKKPQINISLTKIIPQKNDVPEIGLQNKDKINLSKNTVLEKTSSKHKNVNIQSKQPTKSSKYKHNMPNKKHSKISKRAMKCNCKKTVTNLIEMFEKDTHSIKNRCKELSYNVRDCLNIKNFKQINDTSMSQMNSIILDIESKDGKCIEKKRKIYTNTKSQENEERQRFNNYKPIIKKMRSYDLLHTVLNTQEDCYDQESKKETTVITFNRSNNQCQNYTKSECYFPKLTYESHKYDINSNFINKKLVQNKRFIGKQSRDNFNIYADKHKEQLEIKTGKNTKCHGLYKAKNIVRHNTKKFNQLFNNYNPDEVEFPFSIDISGTDIIEFSKHIRNQVISDMNLIRDNEDSDSPVQQVNFGVSLNIEKTYTILLDSFYNYSQSLNAQRNHKKIINETISYPNVNDHDIINNEHASNTSNVVFTSTPHHLSQQNFKEPLDICEAVLDSISIKDIEKNFNDSFNINPKEDLSSVIEISENINKLLNDKSTNKSQINSSNNKPVPQEKSTTLLATKETNEILKTGIQSPNEANFSNETFGMNSSEKVQDNSNNFKLNTRHRFVPKGMSQIFKNCLSKNRYLLSSSNLDTEYYENAIYNNFVEEVAVNSEIFEPNVQNLKSTGNIEKVTERLKKDNADLIFGTDSLRTAKVLGQVDSKFIAAIILGVSQTHQAPEFLVFFDQHAAHERIRLEKNMSYYIKDNNWTKVKLEETSVKSSKEEILYLHNHKDKFARFGLEWTITNNSEILLKAIPEAIRGKNPRPMEIIIRTVKDLIAEQMYAIKHLKGNVSLYPQSIMHLVFSEACRYAIKFGDHLSLKDCVELIAELANCKTPFQCAHGRPVMAVMVELKKEKTEYKVRYNNNKLGDEYLFNVVDRFDHSELPNLYSIVLSGQKSGGLSICIDKE